MSWYPEFEPERDKGARALSNDSRFNSKVS